MKNTIYPLFAYPVVICRPVYEFSDAERTFIADLEMIDNVGNSMSKDEHVLDREELTDLRKYIDEQILIYKRGLLRIKDDNEIFITQSWVNRAEPDEYHPKHKHPNSIVSGVMYLDDNSDETLPPIQFHRTQEMFSLEFAYDELNEFNASCRTFDPVGGMLVLFPSLLEHDVGRNDSKRSRTSLSFNTFVRGVVGGRASLTEVDLS
jgi:uncharacterized protein (TIGR02466 family)